MNIARFLLIILCCTIAVGCGDGKQSSDPKQVIRAHIDPHLKKQGNDVISIVTSNTQFGKLIELWQIRNLKIATRSNDISEADRLNGIEQNVSFDVKGTSFRIRQLFPREDTEWSKWMDKTVLLTGSAIKKQGSWEIELSRKMSGMFFSARISLEHPDVHAEREESKRVAAERLQERIEESKISTETLTTIEFPMRFPSRASDKQEIVITDVDIEFRNHYGKKHKLWFGEIKINRLRESSANKLNLTVGKHSVPLESTEQRTEVLNSLKKAINDWQTKYPDLVRHP